MLESKIKGIVILILSSVLASMSQFSEKKKKKLITFLGSEFNPAITRDVARRIERRRLAGPDINTEVSVSDWKRW